MLSSGVVSRCLAECGRATGDFRMGAVIFKGKRIFSSGHNGIRTSPISMRHKASVDSLHAEQAAAMNMDWDVLRGASILVMRISRRIGRFGNARPCPMCQELLSEIGIRKIYYSTGRGQDIDTWVFQGRR